MSKAKNLATFSDNVDSSGNITDLNVDSNTLVVDAANNRVGIGTAPNKKLHVYRNDTSTDAQILVEQAGIGDATVNFLKTGVYAWMTGIDNTDNKYKISGTGDDLSTNNYLAIDTSGNVGIGTDAPTTKLDVNGDLRVQGNFTVDGEITLGNFTVDGEINVSTINTSDSSAINIATDVVMNAGLTVGNHILPSSNENIDLGSASFRFRDLYLSGNVSADELDITKSGAAGITVDRTTSDGDIVVFQRSGTTVGSISVTTAGTTYNTTSDYRLKENIETITDGKNKIMAMKPSTFNFIEDINKTKMHGFIAQEMQEIVPEAVSNGTTMSMDYGRITPVIVAALQDALKEIEELKERIKTLEAK